MTMPAEHSVALMFVATYGAVLAAEVVGDKLFLTTGILATRFRKAPIVAGMMAAFALKMGVAVAVGRQLATLPPLVTSAASMASFLGVAFALWRKPDSVVSHDRATSSRQAAVVTFGTIFFAEWADVGQITAATMAARFGAPVIVWLGAVAALATKGSVATFGGAAARTFVERHLPVRMVRYGGVTLMLGLAMASALETLAKH